jgi:hypothetical protein
VPPGGEGHSAAAMAAIARHIAREAEQIANGLARRLHEDPLTPHARRVSTLELKDHIGTLLTDVAKSLSLVAEMGGEPSQILRDGMEVQRLLSELHGAQRARLGWTETAHAREFEILRDEVETSVRWGDAAVSPSSADVDMALALLRGFIEHAEHASLRGIRLAVAARRT